MARAHPIAAAALLLAAAALQGCAEGGLAGTLRAAGVRGTPDEFLVLPTRPLEMPPDLGVLPPPTPGATNRVDYRPRAEAIAGLTGRPETATASGAALVARAGPAQPGIRATLAVEDAEWRATHRGRLLERWFSRDREALTYRDMRLDAAAEFERLRALGLRVPPAPPDLLAED
jgi:hypothetical protein